ncbi:hypothetical protein TC41_0898 [Alicyclobacillus acidocaldarius subsp. acidocaldarius Tc-4-1]|uniref:Uncharacterized protein n=1 Tax=Alicyclobacillus acidocaldarius (strain Tc-4-1) TaxID=1048834 RepID=F8IFE9_ALIAT|nr:hypothetical protein TC41_0898 [Alicyclobacillus acidocaldarius subsp. acidocaldarius Tc-4-1]
MVWAIPKRFHEKSISRLTTSMLHHKMIAINHLRAYSSARM